MATGPIETHLHRSINWENGAPGPQEGPRGRSANCGNGLFAQCVRLRSEINHRDSYDFTRYATHLRYLFKRIQAGESLNSANMQMYKNFREEFPQLAECVKHIGSYCRETWDATLSEEEELYLMIHLNRIISKKGL